MAGAGTICSVPKPMARTRRRPMSGKTQGLPASAAPAGGGKACPAWQRCGRILYGAGRKINPGQYDKNTTQTGDDLCRICLGKRRKPLKMLGFCFLENRGNRFTRRRSLVRVQQSPPTKNPCSPCAARVFLCFEGFDLSTISVQNPLCVA